MVNNILAILKKTLWFYLGAFFSYVEVATTYEALSSPMLLGGKKVKKENT